LDAAHTADPTNTSLPYANKKPPGGDQRAESDFGRRRFAESAWSNLPRDEGRAAFGFV